MPRIGTFFPTTRGLRMTQRMAAIRALVARSYLSSLAIACIGVELGCSHLRSRPQKAEVGSATLGAELPGRDIYAGRNPNGSDLTLADRSPTTPTAEVLAAGTETPRSVASPTRPGSSVQPDPAPDGIKSPAQVPLNDSKIANSAVDPQATTRLIAEARSALDAMTTYQLALNRQERVNGNLLPAEDLIMSIRRSPQAARLTWSDGPHRGREVLYRADEPGGQMHVNMADSKFPMPRLALAPDSPMVMKNSRHPITSAGLDPVIASLEQANRAGTLVDLGMQTPPQVHEPLHVLLRTTPEGDVWHAYLDPANHLPVLVECQARNGDLLERYQFNNIQPDPPELASNGAFDPDVRWGAPRGLFGRMATKTGDGAPSPTTR